MLGGRKSLMGEKMRVFTVVAVVTMVFATSACTHLWVNRNKNLVAGDKVAVLLVDKNGEIQDHTMRRNYVFNSMLEHGLTPVSFNTADPRPLVDLYLGSTKEVHVEGKTSSFSEPIVIEEFKSHLEKIGAKYLLMLYVDAWGVDEYLRAVVLDIANMTVVASKFYSFEATLAGCLCVPGWSLAWCGFLFTPDTTEVAYRLIGDMLDDFMGTRRIR